MFMALDSRGDERLLFGCNWTLQLVPDLLRLETGLAEIFFNHLHVRQSRKRTMTMALTNVRTAMTILTIETWGQS